MKVEISEPKIEQVLKRVKHPSAWEATFDIWDSSKEGSLRMEMKLGAPTKERLQEKIEHLKSTGIILRD